MATLVSKYSVTANNVLVGLDQFVVSNFSVRRGFEGPQVLLAWDDPVTISQVESIKVVRKLFDFPANASDGVLVFEGSPNAATIADIEGLPALDCVYYAVFSKKFSDDIFFTTERGKKSIIVFEAGNTFSRLMYDISPESYKVAGKLIELGGIGKVQLEPNEVGEDGETYNLYEILGDKKNIYERLLKVFGGGLDDAKGLIDGFALSRDSDTICIDYLQLMASKIGLQLTEELPGLNKRQEVKSHVALLKIKGTKRALEAKLRSATLFNVKVEDINDFILVTPIIGETPELNGDIIVNVNGDSGSSLNSIVITFEIDFTFQSLTKAILKTINKIIKYWTPFCTEVDSIQIGFDEKIVEDSYDVETEITDSHYSEAENEIVLENVCTYNWMITNDPEKETNDPRWLVGGGESCTIFRDEFFDELERQSEDIEEVFGYRHFILNSEDHLANSRSLIIDVRDNILSVVDEFFDVIELNIDEEIIGAYGRFLITNDDNSKLNDPLKLTAFEEIAADCWWDEIEDTTDALPLVSRLSDGATAILPAEKLVSPYSFMPSATPEKLLTSKYSDSDTAIPSE